MSILHGAILSLKKKLRKNHQAEFLGKKELAYFANCQRVLDIGCGIGGFVKLDPKKIIGLDQNKKSLAICKKKRLEVVWGKITKLPFSARSFDGVHCSHVIEHLPPKEAYKMLKEIARVLKKRGFFVLATPILWSGFYNDFTHIKPYYPKSIMRYLGVEGEQKTLPDIKARFKKVDFYWRFRCLPLPGKLGYFLANFLYQFGLHSIQKDGYTLILEKLK